MPIAVPISSSGAAVELVALHAAGSLTFDAVRDLGSIVVGRSLLASEWWPIQRKTHPPTSSSRDFRGDPDRIKEKPRYRRDGTLMSRSLRVPVRLAPAEAVAVMSFAVGAAFDDQGRVRIGREWLKSGDGGVCESVVPVRDLAAHDLAAWLRRRFYEELERDFIGTDDAEFDVAAFVSEFSLRGAVHPMSPPGLRGPALLPCERELGVEERLQTHFDALAMAGVLDDRERDVLLLRATGETEAQIAATLRA